MRKVQILKATISNNQLKPHVFVLNEVKDEKHIHRFRNSYNTFFNISESGRAGSAILTRKDIVVINSCTEISDTVLLTIEKGESIIILATSYFSARLAHKASRFGQILEWINSEAIKYSSSSILLYGDLNST